MKNKLLLETLYDTYEFGSLLGQGGAGKVYEATTSDGKPVAIKVLTTATRDKKKRFKNETSFLLRASHKNIVQVIDHGVTKVDGLPAYVMNRYDGNYRDALKRNSSAAERFRLFSEVLEGVEAAHLLGTVHRDLKPENILFDQKGNHMCVADFGVASFTDDVMLTAVETQDGQRLANFMYAAPEQRIRGGTVSAASDIYSLGLMLNETFTGSVPHGAGYATVGSMFPEFAYIDAVVEQMIQQNMNSRPQTVALVKGLLSRHREDLIARQKISKLDATVIPEMQIDEALALEPPVLIDVNWDSGVLTFKLDRPVTMQWFAALQNMGNYSATLGRGPQTFNYSPQAPTILRASAMPHEAQSMVDHFKTWLPKATQTLKNQLESEQARRMQAEREQLRIQQEHARVRQQVNTSLKI